MKSQKEMLEYIGKRIIILRQNYDKSKSRLQKEKARAVLQEYYELMEYMLDKTSVKERSPHNE